MGRILKQGVEKKNSRFLRHLCLPVLDCMEIPLARRKISAVERTGAIPPLQPGAKKIRAIVQKGAIPSLLSALVGAITNRATGPKSFHRYAEDSTELTGRQEVRQGRLSTKSCISQHQGTSQDPPAARSRAQEWPAMGQGCTP